MQRIGIYAGAFDPVHSGHVAFALQAMKAARLDVIYFVPERRPRGKDGITHFGHRVGMLHEALKPHPNLKVLDLPDRVFTVEKTLPRITQRFAEAELSLLMGSDVAEHLAKWPNAKQLLERCELVVGLRVPHHEAEVLEMLKQLPLFPPMVTLVESQVPHVSSSAIRRALRHNLPIRGVLSSVWRYARAQWLYVSLLNE